MYEGAIYNCPKYKSLQLCLSDTRYLYIKIILHTIPCNSWYANNLLIATAGH